MEENIKYSAAIAELEDILRKMQSENCDIDNLTDYTKRALQLLKVCKQKLTQTDEQLKRTLSELA